jgi:hypothetical protein
MRLTKIAAGLTLPFAFVLLAAAPARAEGPPDGVLSCATGPHSGTFDGEAETVTEMVCTELRHAGARGAHVVTVSKLGSATFLSVTDKTGDSRRLQIAGLEEVPVAAPRLATSMTHKTTTAATQEVDNIVAEEQRALKTQKGEGLAGAGLATMHIAGAAMLPAINLRAAYETTNFSAVGDLRYGWATEANDASAFTLGIGGRYFFGKRDIAPFAGGGMSYSSQSFGPRSSGYDNAWSGSNSGVGAYTELGVEALRTHRSRLAIDFRADIPFYAVSQSRSFYGSSGLETSTQHKTIYSVPLSLALAYSYRGL